jgi:hypothetical protein
LRGEVLRARESSGLSVDPEAVTRARANSRRADYPFPGLFFTPEEERELESVDDQLADRVEAVLMDADADMGEVRWDWRDGRRVVVVSVTQDLVALGWHDPGTVPALGAAPREDDVVEEQ